MKVAGRNRYIKNGVSRPGGTVSIEGGNLATYSETLTLTNSFEILEVMDTNTLRVNTDQVNLFSPGEIMIIEGSTNKENDKLFVITSANVLPNNETNIVLPEASLITGLTENGQVHLAKTVEVQHNLNTQDIIYRLKEVASGSTAIVTDDSSDNNKLILKPETPIVGDFRITVFAKQL